MPQGIHLSHIEKISAIAELAPMFERCATQIDSLRNLPPELFNALIERDLFRLVTPHVYGGQQMVLPQYMRVLEAVAKYDASTAWCMSQNNVCATVSAFMEEEAAREIFLGPDSIVAWGPGPGELKAVEGGFRVSGKFSFASGSRHATWLGVHLPITEPGGAKRSTPEGKPITYTALFPRARAQILDTWDVIGLKGTGSDSFVLSELFVPERFCVRRTPGAIRRIDAPLYQLTPSMMYASGFASIALGIARATFDAFVSDARDSIPRGAKSSRGDNSVMQAQVGRAEARITSSRMYLFGTIEECWAHLEAHGALPDDAVPRIRLASTWTIQQCREVVADLYVAAGAMSIFADNPFERRFRDIHTLCQQIQGHAAHFESVGQVLLGLEPSRPLFTF
jgi:indole-3-acetate monooxygenase